MLINLTGVLSQEGRTEAVDAAYEKKQFDSRLGSFKVANASPIHFELEHLGDYVLNISGKGEISLWIPCGRCLELVKVPFLIDSLQKVNLNLTLQERDEEEDSGCYIEDQQLDVDKFVDNEILINWPLRVLCKDDCKGICSHCGCNLNVKTCDCDTTELDPRMAAISDIFNQFKEV